MTQDRQFGKADIEARKQHRLDLMDRLMVLWYKPHAVVMGMIDPDHPAYDKDLTVGDAVAIRLIAQATQGTRDIEAIKIILDRVAGPVKQKIDITSINDFDNMSDEELSEHIQQIYLARQAIDVTNSIDSRGQSEDRIPVTTS
jgi:hypothetical protein